MENRIRKLLLDRLRRLCLIGLCATSPVMTLAAGIGIGTIQGTYEVLDEAGPVHGYVAVVETMDADLFPLASEPDPSQCGGESLLRLETTLAWQQRVGALLAFNGGFWYMPSKQPVPDCQMPTRPYKSAELFLDVIGNSPASPVLALATGKAPVIGYADRVDFSLFDVIISGDWVRPVDRQAEHRSLLLVDGRVNQSTRRDPRTAVGVDRKSGRLIVVMVEGRRPDSQGLSLNAVAHLMRACGAVEAMNLDGGGSSTFSYLPLSTASAAERVSIHQLPLAEICDKDALNRDGLALTIEQHSLDRPLHSRPAGGGTTRSDDSGTGYRPVLSNIGFGINRVTGSKRFFPASSDDRRKGEKY